MIAVMNTYAAAFVCAIPAHWWLGGSWKLEGFSFVLMSPVTCHLIIPRHLASCTGAGGNSRNQTKQRLEEAVCKERMQIG